MTCPKCGKTDCADSPCARCGHYLQFAPTPGSASHYREALIASLTLALELVLELKRHCADKEHLEQERKITEMLASLTVLPNMDGSRSEPGCTPDRQGRGRAALTNAPARIVSAVSIRSLDLAVSLSTENLTHGAPR